MKIFEVVKINLASDGFVQEKGRFHTEQWLRTFEGFLAVVLQCLFLAIDAVTVKEYMESIFMTTVR